MFERASHVRLAAHIAPHDDANALHIGILSIRLGRAFGDVVDEQLDRGIGRPDGDRQCLAGFAKRHMAGRGQDLGIGD